MLVNNNECWWICFALWQLLPDPAHNRTPASHVATNYTTFGAPQPVLDLISILDLVSMIRERRAKDNDTAATSSWVALPPCNVKRMQHEWTESHTMWNEAEVCETIAKLYETIARKG
jgi:hypothetical protein